DNNANMLKKINESGQFSVNILSEDQKHVSRHFAGQEEVQEGFNFNHIEQIPVIENSLVSVVCDVYDSITAGDHTLFIGKVLDIYQTEGEPLTFFCGKYGENTVVS